MKQQMTSHFPVPLIGWNTVLFERNILSGTSGRYMRKLVPSGVDFDFRNNKMR